MLLMPSEHAMSAMKADYAAMRNMIYGDYPSFDEILRIIKQLESEINSSLLVGGGSVPGGGVD